MEQNKQETIQKLDLGPLFHNFFRLFARLWPLVLAAAVLLGGLRYVRSSVSYVPMYTASATFSVSTGMDTTTDIITGSSYYDNQATKQIVSSFPYIVSSEAMTERILETLGTSSMGGRINTPVVIGDSNFYTLSATSQDPQRALDLLNAVIENYPQVASFVVGNTQLSMLEEPTLPVAPSNQNNPLSSAIKWGIVGGVCACLVIFLLAASRSTVQKPEDLQKEVNLRCLGEIPQVRLRRRRKNPNQSISMLNNNTRNQIGDAFSALQVKLLRELERNDDRMLLVTSTMPGEGKTTVAVNLALSLAQNGRSVILVDADLRNQQVKNRLGVSFRSYGLAELISGKVTTPEDALTPIRGTSLLLLAGDTRTVRAMDQVDSPKMQKVLSSLRELADYVIVDAPPSGILGDAAVLGRSVDKALYVVRYDGVSRRQVVDSILGLSRRNVELCGYVINGAASKHSGYGYGKYGYGAYGKKNYGSSD